MDTRCVELQLRDGRMVDTIAADPELADEQKQSILYENAKIVFWDCQTRALHVLCGALVWPL